MKVEVGSFSVNSSNVTLSLNDYTLNVKGVHFIVPNGGSGFADGTSNRAMQGTNKSTTYSVLSYNGATLQEAGYVTSIATTGEFSMHFDNYLVTVPIYFMVVGD